MQRWRRGGGEQWHRLVGAALVVLFLAATGSAARPAQAEPGASLETRFDEQGLAGLDVNGQALLAEGAPTVRAVRVTDRFRDKRQEDHEAQLVVDPAKDPYAGDDRTFRDASAEPLAQQFDREQRQLTQRFPWGTVTYTYAPIADHRLDITIHVNNTSDEVIESLSIDLLTLNLPGEVEHDRPHHNLGGPTALLARYEGGKVVLANEQVREPLRLAWQKRGGAMAVAVRAGHPNGGAEIYDGVWEVRPIDAGKSDTYELSLRFGGPDADTIALAQDIYDRYRQTYPPTLQWHDRRPIGNLFLAGGHLKTPQNPRGWGHGYPGNVDVNSPEGRARLRDVMDQLADRVIEMAQLQGLQGIILWDMEGAEYPHPTTYIGEPRVLKHVAPEMGAVIDDFFAKLDAAGLRYGVTIRPTLILPYGEEGKYDWIDDWTQRKGVNHRNWQESVDHPAWQGLGITPEEAQSPLARLDNKIAYAKQRWGVSLIYVDTPHLWRPRDRSVEGWNWQSKPLNADVFEALSKRHPDVLIVPEHSYPRFWAYTAPYHELGYSPWVTRPAVRAIYPEGFIVQAIANRPQIVEQNVWAFVRGVVEGDTFPVHGWWPGQLQVLRSVFEPAAALAPWQIHVEPEAIFVNGEQVGDLSALRQHLASRLRDDLPLIERRVFISYAPGETPQAFTDVAEGVDPERLKQVVEAVTDAGGVIAWSQAQRKDWRGYWGATEQLEALQPRSGAYLTVGEDQFLGAVEKQTARLLVVNRSPEARELAFRLDASRLGAAEAGALTIEQVSGPAAEGNPRFDEGVLKVDMQPWSYRELRLSPR